MKSYEILSTDSDGEIRSVRRKSDNEIFTVGEKVTFSFLADSPCIITKLWISVDQLRMDTDTINCVLCAEYDYQDHIDWEGGSPEDRHYIKPAIKGII